MPVSRVTDAVQSAPRRPPVAPSELTTAANAARVFWPLAAAIMVGTVLRFYELGANSLWADELATLLVARNAPTEILNISTTANFIPPLYFLIVHGVLQAFGESEVALRLGSAVAGVCTIPVIYLLVHEITRSRGTASVAGLLLAVNPLHLWFSQEARPYALLLLLGCCTLLALARAMHTESSRYWIAFTVFGALTFLTHTTGVMIGAISWSWALLSSDRRRVVRPLLASSLAIVGACAPFVFRITSALVATGGTFHSPPRSLTGLELPYTLLTYVSGFSFGPALRDIQNCGAVAALQSHPFQSAIAGAVLLGALVVSGLNRRPAMMYFLVLLAIPLLGILVLSALSGKAYNVRYTLPALVGFIGIVSIAGWALRPVPRVVGLTAIIGVALWADVQWFRSPAYGKEDSRGAVSWLLENLGPGATVAVAPSYSAQLLAYYAGLAGAELRFIPAEPAGDRPGSDTPDALVLTRLHHVPDWRELKAHFASEVGIRRREVQVVGYEILVGQVKPE